MKNVIVFSVLTVCMLAIGVMMGRTILNPVKQCHKKHINRMTDGRFMVIPVDTVDDRPTYNVVFEDEKGYDSMYPEEIANSLNTGKWQYNEMLRLTEE